MQGSFTYDFCFGRQEKTKNALQRFLIFLCRFLIKQKMTEVKIEISKLITKTTLF
jgi:hypothetical protein